MLFNTYPFILGFLPVTLVGFFVLGRFAGRRAALAWLVLASLFFYGWWKPIYLLLLGFSMLFNFSAGILVSGRVRDEPRFRKAMLVLGVTVNLGLIGYFKYANFFVDQVNLVFGAGIAMGRIVLPLAISFFTFQQIAYLVDAYRGYAREYHFVDYCLFVSFFAQLIAGPIVHHKEVMPQFQSSACRFGADDLAQGITYFALGLFKKVVLADNLARFATPVFAVAARGGEPTLIEAWGGVLAYTGQIYFDFSGYSDMAVGLGWMIGIRLPVNFHSPYKARSIGEFWRRWHITLSQFLRDYLYIPLGGNRKGRPRRYVNLMITMLLGGLWHGAGWTFVIWGGLHGLYLVVHHGWRRLLDTLGHTETGRLESVGYHILTFLAVVVGWAFFRAENLGAALSLLGGMTGAHGVSVSDNAFGLLGFTEAWGVVFNGTGSFESHGLKWIGVSMAILFLLPNTQEFMRRTGWPAGGLFSSPRWLWKPTLGWALIISIVTIASLVRLREVSEFLYFQF